MELFTFPPFDVELTKGVSRHDVGDVAGSYDENAHKFGARLFRDGEAVDISGCTVSGYFIRPNGYTVTLKGTVEDGIAWVTLNKSCYYYDGAFTLAVKVTDVGIGTVLVVDGRIIQTRTDSLVDEENTIPSLEAIYSSIERVEQATAAANEAAANAAKTPYIGEGGVWYFWDAEKGMYVDSLHPSIPSFTFKAVTGEPGTNVQMVQTGTPEEPVITLTIPRGDTGAVEGVDYFEGEPSSLGTASPGTANGLARGDHVHPMPTADDVAAVSHDAQTLTNEQKQQARTNIGAVGYDAQVLTSEQKQQARENIGSVGYEVQNLTDEQKQQARENIGAGTPNSYTLPTATSSVLGGVKIGSKFTASNGVLDLKGAVYEMVTFIAAGTYSKDATINTSVPYNKDAVYLGKLGGAGASVIFGTDTLLRMDSNVIESVSGYNMQLNTVALTFTGNGASKCTLSYINRILLNGTSNSMSRSGPTSIQIGPIYMLRKLS